MDNNPVQSASSKVEQMVVYRLYLMHLLPYCEPDYMGQIKAEIAFVDSFIAQICRSKSLILVIENQPVLAKTLVAVLRSTGYEAFAIPDPSDAVALCVDLRPDLAVVDVLLGVVNGIDLAVGLRESTPSTKLLLISGYAGVTDCAAVFDPKSAHMSFLERPIPADELLVSVRKLLGQPDVPYRQVASQPPAAA